MKLAQLDIINRELGKTAFIVGLGASAKNDIPMINRACVYQYGNIIVSCNDYDLMTDMDADYWVHANSVDTIAKNHERYNNKKSTIVYADTVDLTDKNTVCELLNVDYWPYDQRNFNGGIKARYTIQELLQKYCRYDEHYSTGDTVAVHMLALSIILGCKTIFITGVDLDYSKGYVNGQPTPQAQMNDFNPYIYNILNDFRIIGASATHIGVKIYVTNEDTPLKNIFEVKKITT